jgi:hypothetical protein
MRDLAREALEEPFQLDGNGTLLESTPCPTSLAPIWGHIWGHVFRIGAKNPYNSAGCGANSGAPIPPRSSQTDPKISSKPRQHPDAQAATASSPGSIFNRHGGSILVRRRHSVGLQADPVPTRQSPIWCKKKQVVVAYSKKNIAPVRKITATGWV